jgi:hypothetical protein
MKSTQLHIGDVSVALSLATQPGCTLNILAGATARSLGEVHNAEKRLRAGKLLRPDSRSVAIEPLLRFIRWGVPHAYPPTIGGMTRGFATAIVPESSTPTDPAGSSEPEESEFVWPHSSGPTRGQAFAPPYPAAPKLVEKNPGLRAMLQLLDLIRAGGVREQEAAIAELERRLRPAS